MRLARSHVSNEESIVVISEVVASTLGWARVDGSESSLERVLVELPAAKVIIQLGDDVARSKVDEGLVDELIVREERLDETLPVRQSHGAWGSGRDVLAEADEFTLKEGQHCIALHRIASLCNAFFLSGFTASQSTRLIHAQLTIQ